MGEAKRKKEIYEKLMQSIRNGDIAFYSFGPPQEEKYMGEAERVDQLLLTEGEEDDK